jgi:Immunity protein 40
VASVRQDALLSALSSSLQGQAVDLSDEGASEYAFPVEISSEVFDALLIANFSILGGDLWKKEDDGFHSCHDGWFANSSSVDSSSAWRNFRERLPEAAGYYLTFVVRRLRRLSMNTVVNF